MTEPIASTPPRTRVVKIGGSVLTGTAGYRAAARRLAARLAGQPGERILAVVSAQAGATDGLLASARELAGDPDPAVLDLLWSTGELRSVALLVLALQAHGVRAAAANVHQAGLVHCGSSGDRSWAPDRGRHWRAYRILPLRMRALFTAADIVVVPGFLARGRGDAVASLGRGGSDLSAILLAAGLDAGRCELIKDVPGYFTADPHASAGAVRIAELPCPEAIAMARQGCGLVQLEALEAARDLDVTLLVSDLQGTGTVIRHHTHA